MNSNRGYATRESQLLREESTLLEFELKRVKKENA